MTHRVCFRLLPVLSVIFLGSLSAVPDLMACQDGLTRVEGSPLRTWTSSDGKHQREGRLIQIDGGDVHLEAPDGKRIKVELIHLSAEDQAFVGEERRHLQPVHGRRIRSTPAADRGNTSGVGVID